MSQQNHESEIVAPPILVRSLLSWVILGLVFLLLIISPLVQIDAKSKKSQKVDELTVIQEIKVALIQKKVEEFASISPNSSKRSAKLALERLQKELFPHIETEPEAARLMLVINRELSMPANQTALATLKSSPKSINQTFYKIYSGRALSSEYITSHSRDFPMNFLGRVAKAHAQKLQGPANPITFLDVALLTIMGFGGVFVYLLGSALLIVILFQIKKQKIIPVGYPDRILSKSDSDRLAMRMVLFFAGFLTIPLIMQYMFRGRFVPGVLSVISEILFVIFYFWVSKTPIFGVSDPIRSTIGRLKPMGKLVSYGLVGFMITLPPVMTLAIIFQKIFSGASKPTHPLSEQLGVGASPITLFMMFVMASVLAPLLEEISFRGTLFPALKVHMKPIAAACITGLLFASVHPQGPILWASLGFLGMMSCLLAYYTGSLVPSMVMHAVHNFFILMMGMIVVL